MEVRWMTKTYASFDAENKLPKLCFTKCFDFFPLKNGIE